MRPCMLETPPWRIVKSTSLWAGSVAQAEVCAMAMGAASASMPVRIAKRFIVESFHCGAVGPLWGLWRGEALSECARKREICHANSSCIISMLDDCYVLQQLLSVSYRPVLERRCESLISVSCYSRFDVHFERLPAPYRPPAAYLCGRLPGLDDGFAGFFPAHLLRQSHRRGFPWSALGGDGRSFHDPVLPPAGRAGFWDAGRPLWPPPGADGEYPELHGDRAGLCLRALAVGAAGASRALWPGDGRRVGRGRGAGLRDAAHRGPRRLQRHPAGGLRAGLDPGRGRIRSLLSFDWLAGALHPGRDAGAAGLLCAGAGGGIAGLAGREEAAAGALRL